MAGPTWDMDVRSYEGQARVAFYVNFFRNTARSRFQERLHLATRYEPMIRAKLRAGGIPEDMSYLAMVESGFDPNAYSSAAAVGMWQFMSSTARDVGLRVDWWVDERRDPARSTDAAVRFITDLRNQFGSLYLAAAAYNGGPGRVSRGLSRFAEEMNGTEGEDRFFALAEHDYLRSETRNYVPQIIAAALVGKEPTRYGFTYDTLTQYAYDSVEVTAGVPLLAIAKAAGTDMRGLRELNPSVLRGMTPPEGSVWMRVPVNPALTAASIASMLADMPEADRTAYHTIKSSGTESMSSIASKAGISSRQLTWYNPSLKSTKKGKLIAGQNVRVPTSATVAGALDVPDPSIEHYGPRTVAATRSGSVHIVKRGETLAKIAAQNHVTVARLKTLNGLRNEKVVAGQAIRLRAPAPTNVASRTSSDKAVTKKVVVARKAPTKSATVAKKSTSAKKAPTKKVATKKPSTATKSASTASNSPRAHK
ncbi:MAG: transglycosylase SLT domain-containing protein [Gemmatimonadaceae bacterium]